VHQIAQLFLLPGLAFSVLLAIPFLFYYRPESDNNLSLHQAEQDRVIKLAAGTIHQKMDAVLSVLRYLSQHNEIKSFLSSPGRNSSINLATEYQVLARQKRLYDQIRFIGLDGTEEVRVNFNGGKPEVVAGSKLQNKHDRYYFEDALWLALGQIHASPLDLNIEQGNVDQPPKPVMLLTPREIAVMELIASGNHTKKIAAQLDIQDRTVDVHRFNIMHNVGVRTLAELLSLWTIARPTALP